MKCWPFLLGGWQIGQSRLLSLKTDYGPTVIDEWKGTLFSSCVCSINKQPSFCFAKGAAKCLKNGVLCFCFIPWAHCSLREGRKWHNFQTLWQDLFSSFLHVFIRKIILSIQNCLCHNFHDWHLLFVYTANISVAELFLYGLISLTIQVWKHNYKANSGHFIAKLTILCL